MSENNTSLVFAHIGDLHLTHAKEQNYKDLLSIIADIEIGCTANIDMVYLPGDNADHGQPHSYTMLSTALKMLSVPVYAIAGDHDMEPHSLGNFAAMPIHRKMPFAVQVKNTACLFIDVCGNGKGGPDFRLGNQQLQWLKTEAEKASLQGQPIVIFMHTFPADLQDEAEKDALNKIIADNNVVLVDMGHTHYNEIANDGKTIFTATRSTGQIEEGPVGYSLVSVYKKVISWRFKLLDEPFPFVMITYPGDHRLATQQTSSNKVNEIRAIVMADKKIAEVKCQVNHGEWIPMLFSVSKKCWIAPVELTMGKPAHISVVAKDEAGRPGMHSIDHATYNNTASNENLLPGSDDYRIGPWPENHVFETQLGPNRNAKPIK